MNPGPDRRAELMALVTLHLGVAALVDWPTAGLAMTAAFVLIRYRVSSAGLVLVVRRIVHLSRVDDKQPG